MPRHLQRASLGLLAVLAAVVGLLVAPVPAFAAPTANEDAYAVIAGGTYTLTPMDNDEKGMLNLDDLALCGITASDPTLVYAEQAGDTVVVELRRGFKGTTAIQYDLCQGSDRATGTITLTVSKLADLRAAKQRGVRGRVVFTNPNYAPVRVTYGSATSGKPDRTRVVPARRSITIATSRHSIFWVGHYTDRDATIVVGDATIKSVQSKA